MKTARATAICAALALTACVQVARDFPARRTFVLDVPRPAEAPALATASEAVLLVRRLNVSERFEGRSLIYRVDDLLFEDDFHDTLLRSPAALVTEQVRRWLAATGAFAAVVDEGSQVLPTHVLEGNVAALYGDFAGERPAAVVELQFFLLEADAAQPGVLLDVTYPIRVPLEEGTPREVVRGFNRAIARALVELEEELRAVLAAAAEQD